MSTDGLEDELDLEAVAKELGDSGERVRILAARIAHEINNPLGSILMAAQYALASKDDPAAQQILEEALADIESDAKRCSEIVRSVLRFARHDEIEE